MIQVSSLLYTMGSEAETIMKTFALTEVEQQNYDTVLNKFDCYFRPKVNYIEYRVAFQQRTQQHDEPIEQFIRALYEISENCNYSDQKHENIRDRIIIGCRDKELSQALRLKGNELTLDDAIDTARQYEQVKQQLKVKQTEDIDEVTSKFRNMSHKRNTGYKAVKKFSRGPTTEPRREWQGQGSAVACGRCGRSHRPDDACPARDRKCRKCNKIGHFQQMCRTRHVKEVTSTEPPHTYFLGSITNTQKEEPCCVSLQIGTSNMSFKVDSGADVTTLNTDTYKSMAERPNLRPTSDILSGAGGDILCYGKFKTITKSRERDYIIDIYVIDGSNLLGRTDASALGFIKFHEEPRTISELTMKMYLVTPV